MTRRRRKNPLLTRILFISVGIHILILPILAHFGAFKAIQKRYFDTQVVVLAPPKLQQPEERTKPKVVAKQQRTASSKPSSAQKHATPQQRLSNLPPVVASNGGNDSGGPTVDSSASGKAGVVPTNPGTKGDGDGHPAAITVGQATGTTADKDKSTVKPVETSPPIVSKPIENKPVSKHVPVYTNVKPTYSPQPTIPDELRYNAVDKTTVVEFVVGLDGAPTGVKIWTSCGIDALDKAAVESVKQWKFTPATRDGNPISRIVHLKVEFKVE